MIYVIYRPVVLFVFQLEDIKKGIEFEIENSELNPDPQLLLLEMGHAVSDKVH